MFDCFSNQNPEENLVDLGWVPNSIAYGPINDFHFVRLNSFENLMLDQDNNLYLLSLRYSHYQFAG